MAIERSVVVPPAIAAYASAHSQQPDDVQRRLTQATEDATGGFAVMQIGSDQAAFLEILVRAVGARHAIEIGTFTGYSALAIARGLGPEGRLLCCDISEEWTAIGREHWELAGVADRIDLRIAPATDTLASLDPSTRFDFAFIDADKVGYRSYLDALAPMMRPGAIVAVDNTLWSGNVLSDSGVDDDDTLALREFNDAVLTDERFMVAQLTIGDGVTLLQRRGES